MSEYLHVNKSIPWENTADILEACREKADATNNDASSEINQITIVNDLQMFLSLAFMLLTPVDRARTYYELEIGRTFVYGLYKDNQFTPVSKMQNQKEANWYIHLMPEDYKTGKTYGEYWKIMPNKEFSDGKKLYEYSDRWLNQGREYKQKCNHDFFFRHVKGYKKLNSTQWSEQIRDIFNHVIGVRVCPKELRKMYITHLSSYNSPLE
jgi:hypothetical protein